MPGAKSNGKVNRRTTENRANKVMFFLKGKMPTCFSAWAVAKDGLTAIEAIALLGKLDKSSCWRPELHEFGHQVSWPHAASALSGQLSRSMTIDVLFRAWA